MNPLSELNSSRPLTPVVLTSVSVSREALIDSDADDSFLDRSLAKLPGLHASFSTSLIALNL